MLQIYASYTHKLMICRNILIIIVKLYMYIFSLIMQVKQIYNNYNKV